MDNNDVNYFLQGRVENEITPTENNKYNDAAIDETWKYVLGARTLLRPSNINNAINGYNALNTKVTNGLNSLRNDYRLFKVNENKETIPSSFFQENRYIENEPMKYVGDRTYRSVLDELGANGNSFANLETPNRPVTFNKNNLYHYLFENEPERLEKLYRTKKTYENPDLIIKGKRGETPYNYYAKAFKRDDNILGHLGISKDLKEANFYQTNRNLRKNNLEKLLKDGQVVYYNLPFETAPISYDMPVKYIINRFSNNFKPIGNKLYNFLRNK